MRLWADFLPNHNIKLDFECEMLDEFEFNRFIDDIQNLLTSDALGEILMFGIDEDRRAGVIIIRCSDPNKIRLTMERIKPIIDKVNFFKFGWETLIIPTKSGGYKKDGEVIGKLGESREDEYELNADLPIPEGFEVSKRSSFFSFLSKLFARS